LEKGKREGPLKSEGRKKGRDNWGTRSKRGTLDITWSGAISLPVSFRKSGPGKEPEGKKRRVEKISNEFREE